MPITRLANKGYSCKHYARGGVVDVPFDDSYTPKKKKSFLGDFASSFNKEMETDRTGKSKSKEPTEPLDKSGSYDDEEDY